MKLPQTLRRRDIAALIPHSGAMCLLERLESWNEDRIVCVAIDHRDAGHPLRTTRGLLSPVAIEYAAQAMALHGALVGKAAGTSASPGFLASARAVTLGVLRLDDLPVSTGEPDELRIEATRQAGDERQILYAFRIAHGSVEIASGRAAVVLNTSLSS